MYVHVRQLTIQLVVSLYYECIYVAINENDLRQQSTATDDVFVFQ